MKRTKFQIAKQIILPGLVTFGLLMLLFLAYYSFFDFGNLARISPLEEARRARLIPVEGDRVSE